jgi:hypothetical protein
MKSLFILLAMGMIVVFMLVFSGHSAFAAIPHLINYQGMLTDNSGNPLSGNFNMTFKIYDQSSGGNKKWEETQNSVTVTNGLFNVILGTVTPIDTLSFNQDYWLDITVGTEQMPSRLKFTSVGYAYRARMTQKADTASYALSGTWGANNSWMFRVTDGNDTTLWTGGRWGISRYGNTLYGNDDHTHVNLGVNSTTGTNGEDNDYCTVGGGGNNVAGGDDATVGGGWANMASGDFSTIGGGWANTVSGDEATVGGGYYNTGRNDFATVGGGSWNSADSAYSTVGGGGGNHARGEYASIGGGYSNNATGIYTTVAGGSSNTASGLYSATVGGGASNTASGQDATVGGGYQNKASGQGSVVPGGYQDSATGYCSFAAGYRAKALHYGSFVWADSTDADFSSGGANEFAIRASGGLRAITKNSFYGGIIDNRDGSGDGLRAYAKVSIDNNWGAVYAVNNGTSPSIYARNDGTGKAGYFNGDVEVTGTINKGALGFKIDHPLDPENKYLHHSGVESPDMMNIYNDNVILDGNGEALVELPKWFETLNRDFRYQLTCIGAFAPVYIAEKISHNHFKIAGGQPGMEVSWQVTGIRQDPYAEKHRIPVEEEKAANERGKYLHPAAYNLPETMGINYTDKEKGK